MRDKPGAGVRLFQREGWSEDLQETPLKLRLLNREAWRPGGLTGSEREVLGRIAAGEVVEGIAIEARTAANLLSAAWLR